MIDFFSNISREASFGWIFFFLVVLVVLFLRSRTRNADSKINFDDLLVDQSTGKVSWAASVLFGSFLVTSLILVYQTFKGTLTDVTFSAYLGAWVAPLIAAMFKRPDRDDEHKRDDDHKPD
jgi:hypothetical protein